MSIAKVRVLCGVRFDGGHMGISIRSCRVCVCVSPRDLCRCSRACGCSGRSLITSVAIASANPSPSHAPAWLGGSARLSSMSPMLRRGAFHVTHFVCRESQGGGRLPLCFARMASSLLGNGVAKVTREVSSSDAYSSVGPLDVSLSERAWGLPRSGSVDALLGWRSLGVDGNAPAFCHGASGCFGLVVSAMFCVADRRLVGDAWSSCAI